MNSPGPIHHLNCILVSFNNIAYKIALDPERSAIFYLAF